MSSGKVQPSRSQPSKVTAELASELRPALLRLTRSIRNQRADMSVTLAQISVLATLRKCGALGAGEVAMKERVQPPTMTKILGHLDERGFIERTTNPNDKRQVIVAITPAGLELLDSERQLRDSWLARQLTALSAAERQQLHDVIPLIQRLSEQ